jgi:hypothetical protein
MLLAVVSPQTPETDPLLTAENMAHRLNVSTNWVWDHSSRRAPLLPVIHIGDGVLRYPNARLTFQVIRPRDVRSTVNSIYEELNDTGTFGSGPGRKARVLAQRVDQQSVLMNFALEGTTTQSEEQKQDPSAPPVR